MTSLTWLGTRVVAIIFIIGVIVQVVIIDGLCSSVPAAMLAQTQKEEEPKSLGSSSHLGSQAIEGQRKSLLYVMLPQRSLTRIRFLLCLKDKWSFSTLRSEVITYANRTLEYSLVPNKTPKTFTLKTNQPLNPRFLSPSWPNLAWTSTSPRSTRWHPKTRPQPQTSLNGGHFLISTKEQ